DELVRVAHSMVAHAVRHRVLISGLGSAGARGHLRYQPAAGVVLAPALAAARGGYEGTGQKHGPVCGVSAGLSSRGCHGDPAPRSVAISILAALFAVPRRICGVIATTAVARRGR